MTLSSFVEPVWSRLRLLIDHPAISPVWSVGQLVRRNYRSGQRTGVPINVASGGLSLAITTVIVQLRRSDISERLAD